MRARLSPWLCCTWLSQCTGPCIRSSSSQHLPFRGGMLKCFPRLSSRLNVCCRCGSSGRLYLGQGGQRVTSEQHAGQKGLESSPPLVPVPQFPVEGRPWRAACPQAGRPSQFPAALVIRAALHSPSPVPSYKEIHTAWGLSQVAALFCSASGCLPRRRRLQGLGLAAGDSRGAHPQGLQFPQTVDRGLALLLLGRFKPRIHA